MTKEDALENKDMTSETTIIASKSNSFFTKKNIVICSIILLALISAVVGLIYALSNNAKEEAKEDAEKNYADKLSYAVSLMCEGAEESESICILIRNVWYNTIYEESDPQTNKYTKPNGYFNDDFNDSLAILFTDSDFIEDTDFIRSNVASVNAAMGDLLNPPDKYEAAYDAIQALYDSYLELTNLATNASGSLNSYSEAKNNAVSEFTKEYQKIQQYIN